MKKHMFKNLIMVAVALIFCFVISDNATAADASSLTFTNCAGGVMISDCNESATGELVIPGQYNGQNVVRIGDFAFDNCMDLTKVVIPEGVTDIGESAFEGCMALKSVDFPESLKTIGAYAFFCCDSLESVQLFPNVTSIGEYAFCECVSLKSVNIPSSLLSISDGTFAECGSLETISINKTLKSIGVDAFYNSGIKTVYYTGSLFVWAAIDFAEGNDELISRSTENFGHSHTYNHKVTSQPDCTQYGKVVYDCYCGDIYSDRLPPKGHTEVDLIGMSPTCTLPGKTNGKICSVCNIVTVPQLLVPATGHKEIVLEAVAPTCISTGLTRGSSCEYCGEVFSVQTVVPVTEHPIYWIYIEEPTCEKEGLYTGYCTYCSENFIIPVAAKGHAFPENQAVCQLCGIDRTAGCRCLCHNTNFLWRMIWKLINLVCRFLRFRPVCYCGIAHY